nr:methyl-accepting chemotaxis protein [uncultured Caldimonas sp.]
MKLNTLAKPARKVRGSHSARWRIGSLRIRTQLAVLAALMLTVILVLVAGSRYGMRVATQELSTVYQQHAVPMGVYGTSLDLLHRCRMKIVLAMETSYARQATEHFDAMMKLEKEATQGLDGAFALLTTPEERKLVETFRNSWREYKGVRERIVQLYNDGDRAQAISEFRSNLTPHFDALSEALASLQRAQVKGAADAYQNAEQHTAEVALVSLVVALVGLLSVGALSWWLAHSISDPIRGVVRSARAIAAGDLTLELEVNGGGEAGELQRALAEMQESLQGMVRQIQSATEGITTASTEIASGNQDLSVRTEQAASSLQQTASSMEQLTGTVKQSADAAQQAQRLAASASDVAAKGGTVVSQVVTTMDEINTASRKIADIIGVIDGIAFQTNILALNAAVEAARAGEQGRGFAVVAGEVRTLAQRSAQAAREIKALIGASVDKVDNGARLVRDAGATMDEIVASVQRVNSIIGEISTAAVEQNGGIAQIGRAVTQLDGMTQQNAALVEQSASAAESLKSQAYRLAEVVQVFRLPASKTATPRDEPALEAPLPLQMEAA